MTRSLHFRFPGAASLALALTLVAFPLAAQSPVSPLGAELFSAAEVSAARAKIVEFERQQRAAFEMLKQAAYQHQAIVKPDDPDARAHLDAMTRVLELRFEQAVAMLHDLPPEAYPAIADSALGESTYFLETLIRMQAAARASEDGGTDEDGATEAACSESDPQACLDQWFVTSCSNDLNNTCLLNICTGVISAAIAFVETTDDDIHIVAGGFGANIPSPIRIIASILLNLAKVACLQVECGLNARDAFCGPALEELMTLTYAEEVTAYWPFDTTVWPAGGTGPANDETRRNTRVAKLPFVEKTMAEVNANTDSELAAMVLQLKGTSPGEDHTTLRQTLIGPGDAGPDDADSDIDHTDLDMDLDSAIAQAEEAAGKVELIKSRIGDPANPDPTVTTVSSLLDKIVGFDNVIALESTVISLEELLGVPLDPPQTDQDTLFELAEKILENFPVTESLRNGAATGSGLTRLLWLESGLLDEVEGFRVVRPEGDGGAAERIQRLVWETITVYMDLGIYAAESGRAMLRATIADQMLEAGRYDNAYETFCRAYQALIPNGSAGGVVGAAAGGVDEPPGAAETASNRPLMTQQTEAGL